jgi:hypothetical protein
MDLLRSGTVEDSNDFDRAGRLGQLIRFAYLRTIGDPSQNPGRKLSGLERKYAALRIRRIYSRLLKLSAEVDHGFHPSLSPFEVLQVMRWLFPDLREDLTNITQSHAQVVFGELPEKQFQLDLVERSWLRIQAYAAGGWGINPVQGWLHDQPGCTCS